MGDRYGQDGHQELCHLGQKETDRGHGKGSGPLRYHRKGDRNAPEFGKDQYFNVPGRARAVVISGETIHQRERLARRITKAAEGRDYKDGYHAVMEEIAYTWFNRLIAIRFMEVNDYLPGHIRPLSSVTEGKVEPDLMTWPENSRLPFTDDEMRRIRQMKNGNDSDALFGMLFLKVCNQLHTLLPRLFEKTDDDTELLLRLPVMDREGVVYRLAHDIPEEDWKEQVQIVGWMYQYYNTEPKKDVFDGLKKNKKITKDTIAPATQLFTPDWIVRYMVENSLGRLWLEGHPDETLQTKWKYYIPEAKQEETVEEKLHALREERKKLNPEDLTFLDPAWEAATSWPMPSTFSWTFTAPPAGTTGVLWNPSSPITFTALKSTKGRPSWHTSKS